MYTRLTIKVSGQNFSPTSFLQQANIDLAVDDFVEPLNMPNEEDYGELYLLAKNEFSNGYPDDGYQDLFIDFFDQNYEKLVTAGATEFQIMIDVYYREQCNFEIFDKYILKKIAKYDICLPISIYKI